MTWPAHSMVHIECWHAALSPSTPTLPTSQHTPHQRNRCPAQALQQQRASSQQAAVQVVARFGSPKHGMTSAVQWCLASKDQEVMGVLAQLATVDHRQLSAVLATAYSSALQVGPVWCCHVGKYLVWRNRLWCNRHMMMMMAFLLCNIPNSGPFAPETVYLGTCCHRGQAVMCQLLTALPVLLQQLRPQPQAWPRSSSVPLLRHRCWWSSRTRLSSG
jgi:hypothetical protein